MSTTEPWVYYNFYFGNANWPSDMLWRVSGDRREVEVEYGVYLDSIEEARRVYEQYQEENPLVKTWEPAYFEESDGRVGVQWWAHLPPDAAQEEWDFCVRAGMGGGVPKGTYKYPYTSREYKALY